MKSWPLEKVAAVLQRVMKALKSAQENLEMILNHLYSDGSLVSFQ